MNLIKRILGNQKGFTMTEIIMALSLMGISMGIAGMMLATQIDAYAHLATRQAIIADARFAMELMENEIMRLDAQGITQAGTNSITFTSSGTSITFGEGTSPKTGSLDKALLRGNEALVDPIASFTLSYYDLNGVLMTGTVNTANIRRIQIQLVTKAAGEEKALTLKTMVTPRRYVYSGYQ